MASESGCRENQLLAAAGCRKKIAERTMGATPTSEPYVPGAGRKYPTPRTVAMAEASRGFFCAGAGLGEASVVAVMGLGRIVGLVVIFAENGLGNDIFFGGPVAEVAQAAALAAKGEVGVHF